MTLNSPISQLLYLEFGFSIVDLVEGFTVPVLCTCVRVLSLEVGRKGTSWEACQQATVAVGSPFTE